jgi:hypothetical protein
MAEIIAFEKTRRLSKRYETPFWLKHERSQELDEPRQKKEFDFPSARPGIAGNLSDLFEQANAVAMRHYDGDPKVPGIVAEKCIELLTALTEYAEPE